MIRKLTRQHTPWLGIAAALTISLCAVVAALGFRHDTGDAYSFLRQNISDLGNPEQSAWAPVFNYGLMLGSVFMAIFIAGVSIHTHTRPVYAIASIGIIATIAMAFVGVYPSGAATAREHQIAAGIAFLGTTGLGASFSLYMLAAREPVFPRWLILPGLLSAATAFSFLGLLVLRFRGVLSREALHLRGANGHTVIDLISLLEWSVLFSILAWSFLTATALHAGKVQSRVPID